MRYSIEPKYWTFVKDYIFLPFVEIVGKKVGRNLIDKYSQNLLDPSKGAI